ncbi:MULTISPECIES: hypothetical protein [unclassified Bradyrhizobium]|uniref:hypothetical protein n=2 Tax=unclassified Bradyrhizobium TaxID=2631580 RepID=UPI0028EA1042|nr:MULTISPECIES: hypothetical protein [unclassified Bradyrhizobium]
MLNRQDHAGRESRRSTERSGEKSSRAKTIQTPAQANMTQWTVKGIDKDTLEASRVAARKRGMKFGAWVNQVLSEAIAEEADAQISATSKQLMEKIAEMEHKLERSVGELKQQTDHIQHDVRVLHLLVPKIANT